jgi:F420-0:gamma-glutamyl ligase-like protein
VSRTLNVPCTVDIERTPEALYAHVDLDGIDIRPGDIVLIHDAPTSVDNGAHVVCQRQATVTRAGWIARLWAKVTAPFWLLVHD